MTAEDDRVRVSDYLANERTYLAWVRTGITIIVLGFVVARFQLLLRELAGSTAPPTSHFSAAVGISLVAVGGLLQVLALRRFIKNQERIKVGKYEPASSLETALSMTTFLAALLLIVYLLFTL